MSNKLVSILILNWNGKAHLRECVNSVLHTRYRPFEILVVDNASTDGSLSELPENELIRVIPNRTNLGYAAGNNVGARYARGEYIVTLNNDIVVEPDWLDEPMAYLEQDNSLAIVSCRQMNYYNREIVDALYQVVKPYLLLGRFGHGRRYEENPLFSEPGIVIGANGASAVYRRSVFRKLGGFCEEFFAYHEECDLQMRAYFRGYRCLYVPNSVVYHKSEASFGKVREKFSYYHERNRIWFIYRNFPMSMIIRQLPVILYRELRTALRILIWQRKPIVYMKARFEGFFGLPKFSTYRKRQMALVRKQKKKLETMINQKKLPYNLSQDQGANS